MGLAAFVMLVYTRGSVSRLVVMYAINVFVTFSLTMLGMSRHWIQERRSDPHWKRHLLLHGSGLLLCVSILTITIYEKFEEGAWLTVAGDLFVRRRGVPGQAPLSPRPRAASAAGRHAPEHSVARPRAAQEPDPARRARGGHARQRILRPRRPHRARRPEPLSPPVQELPVRFGRRDRLLALQGRGGDRSAQETDDLRPGRSTSTSPTVSDSAPTCATRSVARPSTRS